MGRFSFTFIARTFFGLSRTAFDELDEKVPVIHHSKKLQNARYKEPGSIETFHNRRYEMFEQRLQTVGFFFNCEGRIWV